LPIPPASETPEDGDLAIDVNGDLAGILAIAHEKAPLAGADGALQVKLVAGTRLQHNLQAEQVKRLLEGCAEFDLFFRYRDCSSREKLCH
jgi:hypothetical protein